MDGAETELTGGERTTISTDDANAVSYHAEGTAYAGIRLMFTPAQSQGSIDALTALVKGYGTAGVAGTGGYLYVWDDELSDWELIDSDAGSSKESYEWEIAADIPDYFNASNEIFFLLISQNSHPSNGSDIYLYYAELGVVVE